MSIREQQPGHCPGMPGSRYAYGKEQGHVGCYCAVPVSDRAG